MEILNMKVILVDKEDYGHHLRSVYGLKVNPQDMYKADLVIDRDTGKILKSRHF